MILPIEGDRLLRPVEVSGSSHLDREDLSAFPLSLACRKARRGSTKDHEGIVHLGEPVILVVVSVAGALLLGVIVGEPELGVVASEYGSFFEGMLYQALVVRAGLLEHIVE